MTKHKIDIPAYTMIPNVIIDGMGEMSECQFRVLSAIARKTFGWQKQRDMISLTQLEALTGLSRQGVIDGIQACLSDGWIERTPRGQSFVYELLVNDVDQLGGELVNHVDQLQPELVNVVDTQKKEFKEKELAAKPTAAKHPELTAFEQSFSELTGIPIPSPLSEKAKRATAQAWYQPTRRMVQMANGQSGGILAEAVKRMRADGLTIACPRSVESVFISIFGERQTPTAFTGKVYE